MRALLPLLLGLSLAACGQKGPLVLPSAGATPTPAASGMATEPKPASSEEAPTPNSQPAKN